MSSRQSSRASICHLICGREVARAGTRSSLPTPVRAYSHSMRSWSSSRMAIEAEHEYEVPAFCSPMRNDPSPSRKPARNPISSSEIDTANSLTTQRYRLRQTDNPCKTHDNRLHKVHCQALKVPSQG